jgi:putative membrane protein
MELVIAAIAGTIAGIVTGLLPGLHVNTIAAVGFAIVPEAGVIGAVFLLAVGTVHTIVNILPSTYLGAPDDDDVVAVLPAHRMLLAGRGAEAVAVSVTASLTGVACALVLGLAIHPVLVSESALGFIDAWTVWVLFGVLVVLWSQEARKGWLAPLKASGISALAGILGLSGSKLDLAPMVAVPPTALLPMLGGLFGAAGLSVAIQRPPAIPWQPDLRRTIRRPALAIIGSLLAGVTALMPGLTSAVATAMVPGIRGRPLHAIAAMSAINTAHGVLAILVWMSNGRIRTGLADAMGRWSTAAWPGPWPGPAAVGVVVVVAAAACVGGAATMLIDFGLRRRADILPSRLLAGVGLLFLTAIVVLLSGWTGLAFFVLCAAVGRLPLQIGVRRVHLVACLIVPVIVWRLT